MTKKIILSVCFMFLSATSYAATKCIALGPQSKCSEDGKVAAEWKSDWGGKCTLDGKSVQIRGVSACGNAEWVNNQGFSTGQIVGTDDVELFWLNGDVAKNRACFCKIVQPVTSYWVLAEVNNSAYDCVQYCSSACAGKLLGGNATDAEFHNAILGTLFE